MTTPRSPKKPKNRKSSTRVRPKRATVFTARAVPAAIPGVSPAAIPIVDDAAVPAAPAVNPVAAASDRICVQLEPGLEIKDAEGVHRRLLAALRDGRAVIVDVGRVHAVDTAGAQLLLAFQDEAGRRGVAIEFRGESAPLTHTLAVLGLRDKISICSPP